MGSNLVPIPTQPPIHLCTGDPPTSTFGTVRDKPTLLTMSILCTGYTNMNRCEGSRFTSRNKNGEILETWTKICNCDETSSGPCLRTETRIRNKMSGLCLYPALLKCDACGKPWTL